MAFDREACDLLRAERKYHGWSQEKVAEALGVDVTTVRRWEGGRTIPLPYHQRKLCALFAKTPQELGLLPHPDEQEEVSPTAALSDIAGEEALQADPAMIEALESAKSLPPREEALQADPAMTEALESAKSLLSRDELLKPTTSSLSPRSRLGFIKRVPMFRSLNRLSRRPLSVLSTIQPAILIFIIVLLAFTRPPSPRVIPSGHPVPLPGRPPAKGLHVMTFHRSPLYKLTFSNTDPSVQAIENVFNTVYAQLVYRFARDSASIDQNSVTVTFSSDLASPAMTSGKTITLNPHWIEQHPTQTGLLTHHLTLVILQYPSEVPAWFRDGIADYARSVYGPADDDWSLPESVQAHQSYKQGGGIAARFLLWLELHTRLDSVDQLHRALQRGESFSAALQRLTHETVDHLWSRYQAQPDITPTPQQRYQTATSRKPLYQSSFRIQGSGHAYAQELHLSNFAMQADITVAAGDAGGGFFFRNDNTNWYSIQVLASGKYRLWRCYQRQRHSEPLTFHPAIKPGWNQSNRLTIIVQKSSIYLYINGQFITKIDDNHLISYGTLGVGASWFTGGPTAQVRFDKVQVW